MDGSLAEMYNAFFFMKSESNFDLFELGELYPYEFEIYYYMTVKQVKDRIAAAKQSQQK